MDKTKAKAKKKDKGNGMSIFSPDMVEILKRVKRKEPELQEIVNRTNKQPDTDPS